MSLCAFSDGSDVEDGIFDRCGGRAFLPLQQIPSDDRNRSAGKCCRSLRTDDAKRSWLQNRAGHWAIVTMRFAAGFDLRRTARASTGGKPSCQRSSDSENQAQEIA